MNSQQLKDLVHLVILVTTALVSLVGAFYSSQGKLSDFKLIAEQRYAKQDDIKSMSGKLNRVAEDVAEIKGIIKKSASRDSAKLESFASQ